MKLDVESLRALRAVVQAGTFTEAASQLDMSQSAVSWKIKRLEERVGLTLVKRGQEIEPTPDGQDLLRFGQRMLDAHDEAVEHLSRSDLQGVVRLGTNEDLSGGQLADVLARFGRVYPQIRLDVRVQLSGTVREWLDDGHVDLAVLQLPSSEVEPDDVTLWTEPLQWVCAPNREFGDPVPVLSFGPGLAYGDAVDEAFARAGVRHRVVLECPMLAGVQTAAEAGLGVAALIERTITAGLVSWDQGARIPLPSLSEVIRTGPSDRTDPDQASILSALRDTLAEALGGERR